MADIIGRLLGTSDSILYTASPCFSKIYEYTVTLIDYNYIVLRNCVRITLNTSDMDRHPPHSIDGIRKRREGGKKPPKKYRKYHTNTKKKTEKSDVASKVAVWFAKALKAGLEALR